MSDGHTSHTASATYTHKTTLMYEAAASCLHTLLAVYIAHTQERITLDDP